MSNGRRHRRQTGRRRQPARPTLVIIPGIEAGMPARLVEGIERRQLVTLTGACPCGARLRLPHRPPAGVVHVTVEHENDCPAIDVDELRAAWEAGR